MSKAQIYFVLALVLAVLVAVFAVQNLEPVSINFLFWHLDGISKVLVILFSTMAGALAVLFLGVWWYFRRYLYIRRLEGEVQKLRGELDDCKKVAKLSPARESPDTASGPFGAGPEK
ncbi:putative integral membrane protein [Desulfofundulus luciae]|uniref:Integral membrane protein n=1 Tax=Desulfofundulus luciae TaxID=74702 RepID=A0ABU0B2Y1_9FIRM|nr:LapA family protein [Desulfofundulus luciae]MDQ0286281.1 putative integral membrane protein [Desulfofundulus luciae]